MRDQFGRSRTVSGRKLPRVCVALLPAFMGLLVASAASLSDGAETHVQVVAIHVDSVPLDVNVRGLGTVIGQKKNIITSRHVVHQCPRLVVIDNTGLPHHADLLAEDSSNDLAIVRAPTLEMRGLKLRRSPLLQPRDQVWHVQPELSRPTQSEPEVTKARVHDLARRGDSRVVTLVGTAQRGVAAFRPGDSGGPVVDRSGRLVGIVAGVLPQARPGTGKIVSNIGFAINAAVIDLFLAAHEIEYDATLDEPLDIERGVELLLEHTVVVHCHRM